MRIYQVLLFCGLITVSAFGADGDFNTHLTRTRNACIGISARMTQLKKIAGINTALTGVGTVTSGVAFGTGLAKASVDAKAEEIEAKLQAEIDKLNQLATQQTHIDMIPSFEEMFNSDDTGITSANYQVQTSQIEKDKAELAELTKQSKTLGKVRTGTLAGTAVLDTAGAIITANNKIDIDLQAQINECVSAVQDLSLSYKTAQISGQIQSVNTNEIENIISACNEWEYIDLSKINKRATGAAVSGGVGATMAIVGTITSASANSDKIRNDNSNDGKQKEKNLNTASNVLSAGATVSSGVATVFNATQISAIKKAVNVADKCEEALRQ